MTSCTVCGNTYDKAFEVRHPDGVFVFDSFQCAIQRLAPTCARCDCRVIGHGTEADGQVFCSGHCAQQVGVSGVADRA